MKIILLNTVKSSDNPRNPNLKCKDICTIVIFSLRFKIKPNFEGNFFNEQFGDDKKIKLRFFNTIIVFPIWKLFWCC